MVDTRAQQLSKTDVPGLFRYLDPMWIKVIMETYEGLMPDFIPNPNNYRQQLQSAGIFVDRMDLAMRAALNKKGRTATWEEWASANDDLLHKVPYQQRKEIRDFWFAGPTPGRSGGPTSTAPLVGAPGEWFVTGMSGKSESVVVGVGGTVITGSIEFTNANGTVCNFPIGLGGLTIGPSVSPDAGKFLFAKVPKLADCMKRFPLLTKLLSGSEDDLTKGFVGYLMQKAPKLTSYLVSNLTFKNLLQGFSAGPAFLPSEAIGMVAGWDSTPLKPGDLRGYCAAFAMTGAFGPGNVGIYAMLFGINDHWTNLDPTQQSNAIGVISSGSVSLGYPSAGFAFNFFFGEIV
jgi:hypothetical protein